MNQGCEKQAMGRVVETLPNDLYRVDLGNGRFVEAHIASKTRLYCVRLLPGERVTLELSPFDTTRGHITGKIEG